MSICVYEVLSIYCYIYLGKIYIYIYTHYTKLNDIYTHIHRLFLYIIIHSNPMMVLIIDNIHNIYVQFRTFMLFFQLWQHHMCRAAAVLRLWDTVNTIVSFWPGRAPVTQRHTLVAHATVTTHTHWQAASHTPFTWDSGLARLDTRVEKVDAALSAGHGSWSWSDVIRVLSHDKRH